MRPIWSLGLDCLTKLKILTKHERILISYKLFHINGHEADLVLAVDCFTTKNEIILIS